MSAFHDNALMGASGQQGYNISRSVRLRSSASAYLNRTNASSPTNAIKWTWSGWVKRGSLGALQNLVGATNSGSDDTYLQFNSSDQIVLGSYTGAGTDYGIKTSAVFRDPSAWYHVVAVLDTANATSADRAIIYVNGVRQAVTNMASGMWPQNATNNKINTASQVVNIGRRSLGDSYLDGYLTEINFIDGQALTPSSFGETDAVTGVWKPKKYGCTYGTNGFYLNFSDNSSNTAATIGKDYSGNGNNWTPNNISVTSGVTYDSMLDVPTQWADGGNGRGNYAVMNPLAVTAANSTITNGNLQVVTPNVGGNAFSTFAIPASGKWYFEVTPTSGTGNAYIGVSAYTVGSTYLWQNTNHVFYTGGGQKSVDGSASSYGASYADNDVIGVACDSDAGTITFYKNNTSQGSISHTMTDMIPALTDGASASGVTFQTNFGQRPFSYTPPSGFKALNTFNLPTPTIVNGANYMAATLWTGDQNARTISNAVNGVSFKPDLVWTKSRSDAESHRLSDSVRGGNGTVLYQLYSNLTNAESTDTLVSGFASNGFTIASGANSPNVTGRTYVGWQWQAGQGSTSSNTNGSITSTVSVNATAGFSIVTYTGTGANATVGHGLGVAPSMIILKPRNAADNWPVWHSSFAVNEYVYLNLTNAKASLSTFMNSTLPSSTVFSLGTWSNTNTNAQTMVAYCFAEVAGYSKFGSYTGNGSTDGVFVYLGFRARYLLIKETGNANSWEVYDTSRNTANVQTKRLFPNDSLAEATTDPSLDILSNGFKCRAGNTGINRSGGTYIYAAFAENPFKISLAR